MNLVENCIIKKAFSILTSRLRKATISVSNSNAVEQYLLHKLMLEEREIFGALWLDTKNRVIACQELAWGSLTNVCVHPREVVKSALKHNAASVILFHNHPSGDTTPSETDKVLTVDLKMTLALVDVRVLDHFIIGGAQAWSFLKSGTFEELCHVRNKDLVSCFRSTLRPE